MPWDRSSTNGTTIPARIQSFRETQRICQSLLDGVTVGPKPVHILDLLAISHYNIAAMQRETGQLEEGLQSFERSLEYRSALMDAHPSVTQFQEHLGKNLARNRSRSARRAPRRPGVRLDQEIDRDPREARRVATGPAAFPPRSGAELEHSGLSCTTKPGRTGRRSWHSTARSPNSRVRWPEPPRSTCTRSSCARSSTTWESNMSTWERSIRGCRIIAGRS